MFRPALAASLLALLLAGCDMLGIESPEKIAAARDADGRAVGAACRHAGRAIEDCYALNRRSERAAMFAGWREMNDYMRENEIQPVAPQLTPAVAGAAAGSSSTADANANAPRTASQARAPTPAKSPRAHNS
jgi:hypothetical protein